MSMTNELEALARLHKEGALTDAEFTAAKKRIVGSGSTDLPPALAAMFGGADRARLVAAGTDVGLKVLRLRTAALLFAIVAGTALLAFIGTNGVVPALFFIPVWIILMGAVAYAPYWLMRQAKKSYEHAGTHHN